MSPLTKKIVIIILAFFSVGVFTIFIYFHFYSKKNIINNVDWSSFFSDEKKEQQKKNDNSKKNDNEDYETKKKGCEYNGKIAPDGAKARFYIKPSVGIYQDCKKISDIKICNNGFWNGDNRYKFSSCEKMVDCKIDEDTVIKNETEIYMYDRPKVPYGDDCEKYKAKRFCSQSFLLGPEKFKYKKCVVDYKGTCKIAGIILPNHKARVFFSTDKAPYGTTCKEFMKWRSCSAGVMQGDPKYHFLECEVQAPKDCITSAGAEIKHGTSATLYSSPTTYNNFKCIYLRKKRTCTNGVLDGDDKYIYQECVDK